MGDPPPPPPPTEDPLLKAIKKNIEIFNKVNELLGDEETPYVVNTANNFGERHEYFCLYHRAFFYKPWWLPHGVEFRPFRNVRIHHPYNGKKFQKTGTYKRWYQNPAYSSQLYDGGQKCVESNDNVTTIVTLQCGIHNRITLFRETKKCKFYELLFETPLNCRKGRSAKLNNELAIKRHGEIKFTFMSALFAGLFVFIVGSLIFYRIKGMKH